MRRKIVVFVGAFLLMLGIIFVLVGSAGSGEEEVKSYHKVYKEGDEWKGKDVYYLADVMSNETMAIVGFFMAIGGGITLYVGYKMDD